MKDFFKFLFSSFLGTLLALFIGFFILIGIFTALIPSEPAVTVKSNSVLHMSLSKEISDRSTNNPLENLNFQTMEVEQKLGLYDIIVSLEKAKNDDKIKGIYLELSDIAAGMATTKEIRDALIDFKSSGKFILAYADFYSQKAYYLATVADKVYLNPQGVVDYRGLRTELMFFKGTLEKLGVEPQIIRGTGNKFKSAVEPFMYDQMSEANREQTLTYLNSLWNEILKGISESRGISIADLNMYADNMSITNAKTAEQYKFIDGSKYKDEIYSELKANCDLEEDDKLNFMKLSKYVDAPDTNRKRGGLIKEKIAVVYASGEINMGEGDEKTIGSDGISKAIRQARKDSTVKAIVLRVNSPGGSALASDIILREMVLAREAKPVIVSMGDVAASGGYYIACLADTIVASENTITGSIGVFGLMFNIENFLDEHLGISVDRVTTNNHSDLGSMTRKMSEVEKAVIQGSVDEIYDTFISYVADGRGLTKEQVDAIGQGRVWSGENAMQEGLIDVYGGLKTAIEIAAEKAGIEDYRVKGYPKQVDPVQQILNDLTGQTKAYFLKRELGSEYVYYQKLQQSLKSHGIQARMPFDPEIQ